MSLSRLPCRSYGRCVTDNDRPAAAHTPHEHSGDPAAALENLATELGTRGFAARLITPDGHPPSLAISNPEAAALSETVMADAGWFWWPWADRIAAWPTCPPPPI